MAIINSKLANKKYFKTGKSVRKIRSRKKHNLFYILLRYKKISKINDIKKSILTYKQYLYFLKIY